MNSRTIWAIAITLVALLLATCGRLSEAEKHHDAANEFREQGNLQEAIVEYDQAIRLDPQLALAYYNRGVAYHYLGQPKQAIEDYAEALRLDPQHASAYANRAQANTLLEMDTKAQQDVDRAVELGFDRSLLENAIEVAKALR